MEIKWKLKWKLTSPLRDARGTDPTSPKPTPHPKA